VGIIALLLIAFGVIPAMQSLGPVREIRSAIQSADVDATALFYSESEHSYEAEASIRNGLDYPPSVARPKAVSPGGHIPQRRTP
jgi:hypothetical protein